MLASKPSYWRQNIGYRAILRAIQFIETDNKLNIDRNPRKSDDLVQYPTQGDHNCETSNVAYSNLAIRCVLRGYDG